MKTLMSSKASGIFTASLLGVCVGMAETTNSSAMQTEFGDKKPYLVIDLSSGANATSYPVRYSETGPDLSNDACRTTELWFRLIPKGSFTMGSPESELGRSADETPHPVTISEPFYMGVFEVTQKQWQLVMGDQPSYNRGDVRPVEYITYDEIRGAVAEEGWPVSTRIDAHSFLGKIRGRANINLDLPTEAQWEYACRAGTTTALNSGKDLQDADNDAALGEVGRYFHNRKDGNGEYNSASAKVGSYAPNAWGLYDMHGNVWEWCRDWYGDYVETQITDPMGALSGEYRVLRGGDWDCKARRCRSAQRFVCYPEKWHFTFFGFRLCCEAKR